MPDRRFLVDSLQSRYRLLAGLVLLVFAVLLARLVDLQVVRGGAFRDQAENNRIREDLLRAHRGHLLDRYGRVLADNAPSFHLVLDPQDRSLRRDRARLETVVEALAPLIGRRAEELLETIDDARRAGGRPLTLARSLDFRTRSLLAERMEDLPGVEVRPEPARRYPHGALAAHLLGYVGEVSEEEVGGKGKGRAYQRKDLIGRTGIEAAYDEILRGIDGKEYVGIDALGRRTDLFGELPSVPAVPGSDLLLTIDLDLQHAAEEALDSVPRWLRADLAEPPGPRPGSIVAIDPRSGEILAMASRPAFDPNLFVRGLTPEQWREISGAGFPLLNRAIQSSYPPGSTFKVVTLLAGLQLGLLDPDRPMARPCVGFLSFGNRRFRCWKKEGHGSPLLRDALVQSCDVYFYQLGIRIGSERMMEYAVASSLAAPTRIDLPQERSSLIPTVDWYVRERGAGPVPGAALNLSIGQGEILLTPIALARYVSAVVNGGDLLVPRVVLGVRGQEGPADPALPGRPLRIGRLPASPDELARIRDALEAVVMDPRGTGRRARVAGFRVGGKTGTSENPHGDDHALFFGYAPAEDPEIVVVVVLERSGHGGAVAAPTAQGVLEAYLDPGRLRLAEGTER